MPQHELCRATGSTLETVLDLGRQPLANGFLNEDDFEDEYFFDLRCGFSEESCLFQLIDQPSPEAMFHENYAFRTGTSSEMRRHFEETLAELLACKTLNESAGTILEIGTNDGTFLSNAAARGISHIGIEPSTSAASEAREKGVHVVEGFFGHPLAEKLDDQVGKVDIIYGANVFCHVSDLRSVMEGIDLLLKNDGLLVFEEPYLGSMIEKNSFDQIYDEHVFMFSGLAIKRVFETVGLQLFDMQPLPTHGGSMRYWLGRLGHKLESDRCSSILDLERNSGLHRADTYHEFSFRVKESAEALTGVLHGLKESGSHVVAYGATSKSTTIYNYAGISTDVIAAIYDSTPLKQGKFAPGSHIPILPEYEFSDSGADVAFLGAWNHEIEIRRQNSPYESRGGKWLTHVPKVRYL